MPMMSSAAPIGGWNARDALDSMPLTDSADLLNLFPGSGAVFGRGGSVTKQTVDAAALDTLASFTGSNISAKLIGACNGHIYDLTTITGASSLAAGFSSNQWQTAHAANKLILVNGTDTPQVYDGTSVAAMTATLFGVPVISSVTTSGSGGTLTAATYSYRVVAVLGTGVSLPSAAVTVVVAAGTTNSNTINWTAIPGVSAYKVYGRTGGSELLIATTSAGAVSYIDTGAITPSGALPVADTTAKNLIGAVNSKGRMLYWTSINLGFWYAQAGGYQGNLTFFPMDVVFREGGYVAQILTWSRDSGDGVDDITAVISSNGEAIIYQGNDPGTALAWAMTGRFSIGRPLSVRSHGKMASAEIMVTMDGFVSMDEAIVNQRTHEDTSFGGKITRAANLVVQAYKANFGWEVTYYPLGQMLLVNVPIAAAQFEQYVMNVNTGAWCRFNGWNARTFCVHQDRLYFGTNDGKLVLADTTGQDTTFGFGDDGVAIEHRSVGAYTRLNEPGMKAQLTGVQLVTNMSYPSKASVVIFQDYATRTLPALSDAEPANLISLCTWDVSYWDTDYWADGLAPSDPMLADARPVMYSVAGYGFALAMVYRYQNKAKQLIWYSTNYLFNSAGV